MRTTRRRPRARRRRPEGLWGFGALRQQETTKARRHEAERARKRGGGPRPRRRGGGGGHDDLPPSLPTLSASTPSRPPAPSRPRWRLRVLRDFVVPSRSAPRQLRPLGDWAAARSRFSAHSRLTIGPGSPGSVGLQHRHIERRPRLPHRHHLGRRVRPVHRVQQRVPHARHPHLQRPHRLGPPAIERLPGRLQTGGALGEGEGLEAGGGGVVEVQLDEIYALAPDETEEVGPA